MARGDDFPPLFTVAGPLGWAYGIYSVFRDVFGNSAVRRQREKVFREHRERNEARGWKPGDNILRAHTAATEIEARRSAAERAIRQVNDLLAKVPEAPWLARKQLGKGGRLYRLQDVQRNVIRNNRAINEAKIKAQEKEAAARRLARDRGIRDAGVAGAKSRGSVGGTFQGQLAGVIVQDWLGRRLDADAARQRLSTATNRRGALAQRTIRPRSNTNRTGSLAQPRPAVDSGTVRAARTGLPTSTQPGTQSQPASTGAVGESASSREARRIMSGTRSLPTQASTAATRNPLLSLSSVAVARVFNSAGRFSSSSSRPGSSSTTRSLTRSGVPLQFGTGLTPLNSVGVQSASQQGCKCPEPKKKQKSSRERCRNPVVSRTVKDGIRTTKVRLTCPPSRPK